MKIFLLVVTILLLLNRIKTTPRQLSKTIYYAKIKEALDTNKLNKEKLGEENYKAVQGFAIFIAILFSIFSVIYYALVGNRFLSSIVILVLSALQIVTVFITLKKSLDEKEWSDNIEDHKFYRFYFLFNVILDYIYYPLTIYMLLK